MHFVLVVSLLQKARSGFTKWQSAAWDDVDNTYLYDETSCVGFFHIEGLTVPFRAAVEQLVHSLEDLLPTRSISPWNKICFIPDFQDVDEFTFILVDKTSCFQPVMMNGL